MPFAEQIARQHLVHLLDGRYVFYRKDSCMNKWLSNKRIFMLGFFPVLGLIITFLLNFIAGPGYTTSVNQGALAIYFMGSVMWSVFVFFTGIFMYSKCSSMNHIKFILGVLSVTFGAAMPWMIGIS
jgi:hypothetical protein